LEHGGNVSINNILYVPCLKNNLLSISSFEDKGYRVSFVDGQVLVWKIKSSFESSKVIGVWIGGVYPLPSPSLQALFHNTIEPSEIWHRRYAHMHYKDLGILKYFVKGVSKHKTDHDGVWKGCALGKNVKGRCTSGIFDLIHFDVCGPKIDKNLGVCLYYVSFIEDYSGKTWIYLLKVKNKVFEKFHEFKAQVENVTWTRMKTLRYDNSGSVY